MGYTYVMSDIHGMAHLLEQMLEKIRFSGEDTLYILGDMIDRGPDPARVMDIVAEHGNIIALKGNHEDCFVEWYENEADKIANGYLYNTYDILMGGETTRERLPEYVDFMKRLPLYRKVRGQGCCYLLAHASTEGILRLWKRKESFLWDTSLISRQTGVPGYISVVGHVPTFIIRGYPGDPARIWHSPNGRIIDVDCGAAFPGHGGRLACLCLETGGEFYAADSGGLSGRIWRNRQEKG